MPMRCLPNVSKRSMNPMAMRDRHLQRVLFGATLGLAASLLTGCASPPPAASPNPPSAGATDDRTALHALFDSAWEADLRRHPEAATYRGDHRYGDRWTDASPQAEAAEWAAKRADLARAQAIKPAGLSPVDRVSREVFIDGMETELRFEPLVGYRRMSIGAMGGFQNDLADLLRMSPVRSVAEAEQILTRLAAYPVRVDQELVRLREGMALGWVPARPVLERALASLDAQLAPEGEASPYYLPFTLLGDGIPPEARTALQARARAVIDAAVLPAQRRLRAFIAGDYLARAPARGGLSTYPGGAAVYAAAVAEQTTTTLSPNEIHAIGLREVARLHGEIRQVMQQMGWSGDFASFAAHMNTDPRYLHPSPEALLAHYKALAKRIEAGLPALFERLPRAPLGIRPMPAFSGPDRAEYYDPPPMDGSAPGWFNANAQGYRTRPIWGQATLTAHEGMPGHHLQVARAIDLGALPAFRRNAWYVAYGEGWALYAETLGDTLGLYADPASRYGHLQSLMFRAMRLVVDTGLHAKGWSREQAIDAMVAETGDDRDGIAAEVDRYLSWPGQALGYMIGKLKIDELRDRARQRLGPRFDIRRFHSVVLDNGAVPLVVLERLVDEWITAEAARP